MRIGVFGGCFNPPHNMHKNIALELVGKGYLDKVIYVPTGNLYNKKGLIDNKYRYDMLKLITDKHNCLDVSLVESGQPSYTYQTLDYFKKVYSSDEIYFICGSDNLSEFDTWKNYQYILDNYKILVIRRNNADLLELEKKYNSSNVIFCNVDTEVLSSTMVREMIRSRDLNVLKYIDKEVLDYIIDIGIVY